jgi:hypothetical protein
LPGRVGAFEDTHCRHCGETVIRRSGYWIEQYKLTPEGQCPSCHAAIPGRWSQKFDGQITGVPFLPRGRTQFVKILTQQ